VIGRSKQGKKKPDPRVQHLASEEGDEILYNSAPSSGVALLILIPVYYAVGSMNNIDSFFKNKYLFMSPSYLFYLQ
jgi:hypothetical protein